MYEKNESNENVFNYESDFLSPNQTAYTIRSTGTYSSGNSYQNRSKNVITVIGIIFVALAAAALCLYMFVFNTPKARLAKGLAALAEDAGGYSSDLEKLLGTNELVEKLSEDNSATIDMKLNATVQDQTIGVDYKMNYAGAKKLADIAFKVSYSNISLFEGEMKADADKLYVSVPEVTEEWYYVNAKTLGADYNASIWADLLGLAVDEDYSLSMFEEESGNSTEVQRIADTLFEKYAPKFAKEVTIEKSKNKIEIFRGGKSVTCKGINMIIGKDLVNSFVNDFFNLYYASIGMSNPVQDMIKMNNDIKICFYLDNKNNIVSITTAEAIQMHELGIRGIDFEFDFTGNKNVLDEIEGNINFDIGGLVLTAQIDRSAEMFDGIYSDDMSVAIVDATGMGIRLNYTNEVDMDKLQYDGKFTVSATGENIEVLWNGSFKDIQKGKSITVHLDELAASMNAEEVYKFAGDVTIATLEEEIKMPADAINFMDMKEGDLTELMLGVEEYITKFLQ